MHRTSSACQAGSNLQRRRQVVDGNPLGPSREPQATSAEPGPGMQVDPVRFQAELRADASHEYQVLTVGYVSRFCRNVKLGTAIREELHSAGATIYFCDERILLSNEDDWKRWIDLLVSAEHYSRDLSKRVQRGYRSKWRHHGDPGGWAPFGFKREPEPPRRIVIDPDTIGIVVGMFERYAAGTVSMAELSAEVGIHEDAVREMLRNPIYNGWVRRNGEVPQPAPWRNDSPVRPALGAGGPDARSPDPRRRREGTVGACRSVAWPAPLCLRSIHPRRGDR